MILKMDVEGGEYGSFRMMDSSLIEKFDQIIMEIHGINDENKTDEIVELLDKINKTHHLVHIHLNNNGVAFVIRGCVFTDAIEVLFLKRKNYSFSDELSEHVGILGDSACSKVRWEISCDKWNKYNEKLSLN